MANKKPSAATLYLKEPASKAAVGVPGRREFLTSIVDGNLTIRAIPVGFSLQSPIEPEPIDQFLTPQFISPLAAKLWNGDDEQSIGKALALIKGCAEKLAWRKSPLSDIQLGGTSQAGPYGRNARFWRRISLQTVIEIAANIGHAGQAHDAVERAFSIIENVRTVIEQRSKRADEEPRTESISTTEDAPLSENFATRWAREASKANWTWKEAAKRITGITRADRASETLLRFLIEPSICDRGSLTDKDLEHAIAHRKKTGFLTHEVWALASRFEDWHRVWVKSRQSASGKKVGAKNLRKKHG